MIQQITEAAVTATNILIDRTPRKLARSSFSAIAPHPLHVDKLPEALQWWDEERFWLIHAESGLRVPGTWRAEEVEKILSLSRDWEWSFDKDRRVACGLQLIALAEQICKRSASTNKNTLS